MVGRNAGTAVLTVSGDGRIAFYFSFCRILFQLFLSLKFFVVLVLLLVLVFRVWFASGMGAVMSHVRWGVGLPLIISGAVPV